MERKAAAGTKLSGNESRGTRSISRRTFVRTTAAFAGVTFAAPGLLARRPGPNDRLRIAFVGVAGRGNANLGGLSRGNDVVALCDVDWRRTGRAFQRFPGAKRYWDFRRMLDELDSKIDVVVVSTPDHTHAVAAMAAIKRGKHVYCEKPLAHSIHEVRALQKAARENKVVTQLGNQGHSFNDIRRLVEWVRAGVIGRVHTVHAACSAVHCKIKLLPRRSEKHKVPKDLNWDLWLGPAAYRPYNPMYLPGSWRGWRPFGNGTIGDWVCHVVDPAFWALDLDWPKTVQAVKVGDFDPVKHADTFPCGSVIKFEFPAKGGRGPVTLYWYSGEERIPHPKELEPDRRPPLTGAVLLGDKGALMHGSHGAAGVRLIPEARMRDFREPPPTIPRVRNHYADFLRAVREGGKAGSDFSYGGPLTEIALLGIIAMNFPGRKLSWDGRKGRFTDCEEANKYVNPPYREGWSL